MKIMKILIFLSALLAMACSGESTTTLRLGHNHGETNPSHIALMRFADEVYERSNGYLRIQIFPNGVLGDDRSMTEQTQQGILDIVRANSAVLENFDSQYSIFSLPYLFSSHEQFIRALESNTMQQIYDRSATVSGLRGLTYQDTGVRSFYMVDGPVNVPEDLAGRRVRILPSRNFIEMMNIMGAVSTPIPFGEVFTALQAGVIDGAENNIQALTLDMHGEVAKFYSLTEHLRLPDFIVMNENRFNRLSAEHQQIILTAARNSTTYHNQLWGQALANARRIAENDMGVQINTVNQQAFIDRIGVIYEQFNREHPEHYATMRRLQQY